MAANLLFAHKINPVDKQIKERIFPLWLSSDLFHKVVIQVWDPQHKKDADLLDQVLRRDTMNIELKHLFCKDSLRELGLFSLEETLEWPSSI
ncbi:hypothetical protein BTVI_08770 [Pitangus sulphuratus]|nr:hypothetical protein BTVI_08770 [Pitangus sulphuratus]